MEFQVKGFEQLERRLAEMPGKIERRVYRTALRSTGRKIATRLRAGTPVRTGRAKKNVKVEVKSTMREAYVRVHYKSFTHAILMAREFGSQGRGRRSQPGRPFFDRAIGGYEQEAIGELREALVAAVEKE